VHTTRRKDFTKNTGWTEWGSRLKTKTAIRVRRSKRGSKTALKVAEEVWGNSRVTVPRGTTMKPPPVPVNQD